MSATPHNTREDFFETPPVQNPSKIISEMEATGRYTKLFLKSLHRGLQESVYFSKRNA